MFVYCEFNKLTCFNVGQVMENTTLFTYSPGENISTYANTSFVPIFLDEPINFATDELRVAAELACQGDANCLFDIASTGDVSVGESTKQVAVQIESESQALGKSVARSWLYACRYICVIIFWILSYYCQASAYLLTSFPGSPPTRPLERRQFGAEVACLLAANRHPQNKSCSPQSRAKIARMACFQEVWM